MNTYIKNNTSVWNHIISKTGTKFYCQLATIRGHVYISSNGGRLLHTNKTSSTIVADDFYTLIMQNSDGNKGIRQKKTDSFPTFSFDTELERDNFIGYCKTDFARFCLSLYKNGPNLLTGGGLENIPWLDFTQEWDDQKLYEFFDVNEETQEYIENFLPDYYGIRNKTKEIE